MVRIRAEPGAGGVEILENLRLVAKQNVVIAMAAIRELHPMIAGRLRDGQQLGARALPRGVIAVESVGAERPIVVSKQDVCRAERFVEERLARNRQVPEIAPGPEAGREIARYAEVLSPDAAAKRPGGA